MTGANRGRCLACLLVVAAVVTAFLASGCLWGVVRDAQTGMPVAGAEVSFSCPCETPQYQYPQYPYPYNMPLPCGAGASTNANGIYVIDMLPVAPTCAANSFLVGSHMTTGYDDGFEGGSYTGVFDFRDNPNASFDDLRSFWEVQNFELVPSGFPPPAEVQLVSFDISRARVTDIAHYLVEIDAGRCNDRWDEYITSTDPPSINLEYPQLWGCPIDADQVEVRVTLKVHEAGTPTSESDVSTAGFNWTVPRGATGWTTATLDSADAAGPDDPDLEFTAQIRYRAQHGLEYRGPEYIIP